MYCLVTEIDGHAPKVYFTEHYGNLQQEAEVAVTWHRGFIEFYKKNPGNYGPGVFDTKAGLITMRSTRYGGACIRIYLKMVEEESCVNVPATFSERLAGYCRAVGMFDLEAEKQKIREEEPYLIH